jgi:hypothetical protein
VLLQTIQTLEEREGIISSEIVIVSAVEQCEIDQRQSQCKSRVRPPPYIYSVLCLQVELADRYRNFHYNVKW